MDIKSKIKPGNIILTLALFSWITVVSFAYLKWDAKRSTPKAFSAPVDYITPIIYDEIEKVKQALDNAKTKREFDEIVAGAQKFKFKGALSLKEDSFYVFSIDQLRSQRHMKREMLPP